MKVILWICTVGIVLISCGSSKNKVSLTGMKWVLESMEGQKVQMKEKNNEITVQFEEAEKRVTGMAGCNRFFGGYEADGNKIKFSHMGATRMTCPDQDTELRFFKILENTDTFQIKEQQLTFFQKGKVLALFKGKPLEK